MGIKERIRDLLDPEVARIVRFPVTHRRDPVEDRYRRNAFLIMGVVSGSVLTATDDGLHILDFDQRGPGNIPTSTFYPEGLIPPELEGVSIDNDRRSSPEIEV